ncbi:MAG TPA: hypothetical protein DGH68_09195 [Bacteroidetes bacterium]|nr:hypothetical protein [Bacteroidota bacterium]
MNRVQSRFATSFSLKGRSHTTRIVFFASALLVLSFLAEFMFARYVENNWEKVAEQRSRDHLQQAVRAFSDVQREVRRVGTETAQHPTVRAVLSDPSRDRRELFELVSRFASEHDVGIEVYTAQARLVCWHGSSEPSHQREIEVALGGKLVSFVTRSQVFTQLFVATPVWSRGKILGVVLVRRTVDLNYPLNNRVVMNTGLAEQLTRDLGVQVVYDFSPDASASKDGRYSSAELIGIDSSKVGVVSVAHLARNAYLESVGGSFHILNVILWLVLIGFACTVLGIRIATIRSVLVRGVAATVLIWFVRFVLVWFDLPSSILQTGVFDPGFFASTFGNGLAKSVGEMFLTTCALFVNTAIVGRFVVENGWRTSPRWLKRHFVVRWLLVAAVAVLMFLLLRGYAATIRSAVFDSTLQYNDPAMILPSFELATMVASLFLLSFCLVAVVVGLTSSAFTLLAGCATHGNRSIWFVLAGVYAVAAMLGGIELASPLVSLPFRLFFAASALGITYYLHRQAIRGESIISLQTLLLTFAFCAVFFYPVLDANVHDRDHNRIEAYAQQVIRPADSWLKFVLDEALQEFLSNETISTLANGDANAVDRLAFDRWARSTAAREGYSCIFALTDSSGYELSRFMIGGEASMEMYHNLLQDVPKRKSIVVHENVTGVNTIRVYSGSIPIVTGGDGVLAYGHVVLAASQQSLFRGESPSVLRSQPQELLETFHRPAVVSEFHDGQLVTSTGSLLPIGYQLPATVKARLSDSTQRSFWSEERIDGTVCETFYIKRSLTNNQVVALSMPELGLSWHLVGMVKVVVYYAIVVLMLVIGFLVVQWVRGHRYEFTFRDKLLGALLVTALAPLIVMATYGRQYANDRLLEETANRLEQETATLAASIEQRLQGEEGIVQEALSRDEIDRLATEAGTDFNLYVGNQLQASSRPELYDAEVLDKRLSGLAFANTVLGGKRFYLETETIGSYRYAVGYRPLVSGRDRIAGIVSVPTLYRIEEVEEEISLQNALIFGVYAVVLLAIVIIAATFANRIAAPIHKLTLATKRVARGDQHVTVGVKGADGEIGELIRSFEAMTEELARGRDELVRFERELAWKEMAKQVAHEIKNPLTPMKLSIQHLRQTYLDRVPNFGQVFDDVSRTIIEQIDALSRIAGEFARFARMPKPTLVSVDVNAVLREAVLLFDKDPNLRFELQLGDELPPVRSDREELRRVFINIIRNGVQAMNNSGLLQIHSWSDLGRTLVVLKDEGTGMSEEVKRKLFQPNFSTKTDGMGLGLAITKKTIDDLGGSIVVESEVGKGTTVTIILPNEQ